MEYQSVSAEDENHGRRDADDTSLFESTAMLTNETTTGPTTYENIHACPHELDNDQLGLVERFERAMDLLRSEYNYVMTTPLSDYRRHDDVRHATAAVERLCSKLENELKNQLLRLTSLRECLRDVQQAVDRRIVDDNLSRWIDTTRTPTREMVLFQVLEKEAMARSAEAHAALAQTVVNAIKAEERVAVLNKLAVDLSQDALQASLDAKEAALAAEERRLAVEKRQREEQEERERVEQMQRLAREEEQERRLEEKRRREDIDKTPTTVEELERLSKRDPTDWPLFTYSVESYDTDISLGCVIRASPGTVNRNDIQVERVNQLVAGLQLRESEELVSNIVSLSFTGTGYQPVAKECPLAVAIPYVSFRLLPSRQIIVKIISSNNSTAIWTEIIPDDVSFDEIKEFKFVEVRLTSINYRLAVITRIRKEITTASKRNLKIWSSVDPRITFSLDSYFIRRQTNFTVEVQPVDMLTIQEVKRSNPDISSKLISASAVLHCVFDGRESYKPMTVSIPLPGNPNKQKRPVTGVDRSLAEKAKLDKARAAASSAKARPKTARSPYISSFKLDVKAVDEVEDEIHVLMREREPLEAWSVVNRVTITQNKNKDLVTVQIDKAIKGRFIVLRHQPLVPATAANNSNNFFTSTAISSVSPEISGHAAGVVGLGLNPYHELDAMARLIELSLLRRSVHFLLRQKSNERSELSVHCVNAAKIDRVTRKLLDEGYDDGPPATPATSLLEGQELVLRFRGNIADGAGRSDIRISFNSNIRTAWDLSVVIVDNFAQKSIDCYRGFVQIFVVAPRRPEAVSNTSKLEEALNNVFKTSSTTPVSKPADLSTTYEKLLCEILVNLPKFVVSVTLCGSFQPEDESSPVPVRRVPVVFKADTCTVDSKMIDKLSMAIGEDWKTLAQCLSMRQARIQAILRNNINTNQQQATHEMLMSWMTRLPRAANKAELLSTALSSCGRTDLADYIRLKDAENRREQAKFTRDAVIRRAIITTARNAHLVTDWRSFCHLLGLNDDDIGTIEYRHTGPRDRCYQVLTRWQEQGGATVNAEDLVDYLRQCHCDQVAGEL